MLRWLVALLLTLSACGPAVEQVVVTSPLVGAERLHTQGRATVVEVLPAGSYTYLRLAEPADRWFVVSSGAPAAGDTVAWRGFAELRGFHSTRLDRTFDHLVFATVATLEAS